MAAAGKRKQNQRSPLSGAPAIRGPHQRVDWIGVKTAVPKYGVPVLATCGTELALVSRDHTDETGDHYFIVDAPGSEFSGVSHWCEQPLLPSGKPARFRL
jgi:hypothetical protein